MGRGPVPVRLLGPALELSAAAAEAGTPSAQEHRLEGPRGAPGGRRRQGAGPKTWRTCGKPLKNNGKSHGKPWFSHRFPFADGLFSASRLAKSTPKEAVGAGEGLRGARELRELPGHRHGRPRVPLCPATAAAHPGAAPAGEHRVAGPLGAVERLDATWQRSKERFMSS